MQLSALLRTESTPDDVGPDLIDQFRQWSQK